jgi:copper transport protein
MAFDGYGNLWVAEHTINKIAVIDLRTNTSKEINIPTQSPFVQWLTSDSKGNVWLAEQQGNSLGVITTATAKKLPEPTNTTTTTTTAATATITAVASPTTRNQTSNNNNNNNTPLGVPRLGFSYADIVGPSIK